MERMRAPNMFDTAGQTNKTRVQNKFFKLFDRMFDDLQILSNRIKQHQPRWPKGKMFGHQTMFDVVRSPNISCLAPGPIAALALDVVLRKLNAKLFFLNNFLEDWRNSRGLLTKYDKINLSQRKQKQRK